LSGALAFEYRVQDSRLGRFLSIDPLFSKFPFYSPYHVVGNKPICAIDIEGLEDIYFTENLKIGGEIVLDILRSTEIGAQIMDRFD